MSEVPQDKPKFWNRKTYCVITGASRGIGREISIQFAKSVADGSTFLLLARDLNNLNETKTQMEAVNPAVNIFVHSYNLFKPVGLELRQIMNQSLEKFKKNPEDFELSVIVHNAGSLGDITELTRDMCDLEKMTEYLTLNYFSLCILNTEFLRLFDPDKREPDYRPAETRGEICIVNITSLCAVKPYASMGYYCPVKSCREMFFGVMAEENEKYTILNYSPGPVSTDMTDELALNIKNEELKKLFLKMKEEGTMLTPPETVNKLVKVLGDRSFKSGSRVDYYDADK